MSDMTALTKALGQDPPDALTTVDQATIDGLAEMISDARQDQVDAIGRALDDALRLVPRPLRRVVKKVIMQ